MRDTPARSHADNVPTSVSLEASPFVRLARTHLLSIAGDTCVTVALAGSLFFDISPDAAKGKVALSLILTMAPFAVVAPLLGPAMDRFQKGRRATVFGAALGRAILCFFMASSLNGLVLFPLVFASLVLSKAHAVSKAALVPATVRNDGELVENNSKLALCAGVAGFLAAVPAGILLKTLDGGWTLRFGAVLFAAAALCSIGLVEPDHEPRGGRSAPRRERITPERDNGRRSVLTGSPEDYGPGIIPAATAMAVLRGVVGFMTFFIAFTFRRTGARQYWFGIAIAASALGNLIGAFLAPRLRGALKEEHIVIGALGLTSVAGVLASHFHSTGGTSMLALVVGIAAGAARLAFDSLVQRDNPAEAQGRVFARFEAMFQLVWVVAGLAPVLGDIPLRVGCFVVAVGTALGALAYAAELRTLHRATAVRRSSRTV